VNVIRYCQIDDDRGDDLDFEIAVFKRAALFDMRLEISDVPAAFGGDAGLSGKTGIAQRLAHGACRWLRSRAPSMSASVTAPTKERLPRNEPK